jgi:TonB family protein
MIYRNKVSSSQTAPSFLASLVIQSALVATAFCFSFPTEKSDLTTYDIALVSFRHNCFKQSSTPSLRPGLPRLSNKARRIGPAFALASPSVPRHLDREPDEPLGINTTLPELKGDKILAIESNTPRAPVATGILPLENASIPKGSRPEVQTGVFQGGFGAHRGTGSSGFGGKTSIDEAPAFQPAMLSNWRPVIVLWKPTPVYTDEARALKIQGEVLLQVEFGATGRIRILRIIRGLGHGLDEVALRAIPEIRFRPASFNEKPIDCVTRVHVTFELFYQPVPPILDDGGVSGNFGMMAR